MYWDKARIPIILRVLQAAIGKRELTSYSLNSPKFEDFLLHKVAGWASRNLIKKPGRVAIIQLAVPTAFTVTLTHMTWTVFSYAADILHKFRKAIKENLSRIYYRLGSVANPSLSWHWRHTRKGWGCYSSSLHLAVEVPMYKYNSFWACSVRKHQQKNARKMNLKQCSTLPNIYNLLMHGHIWAYIMRLYRVYLLCHKFSEYVQRKMPHVWGIG